MNVFLRQNLDQHCLKTISLPTCFVDISSHLKEKLDLMAIYESEIGEHPFPRSFRNTLEALAIFRGASAGVEYAEAFQVLKMD